jgi:uncharacterized integral membrane protein
MLCCFRSAIARFPAKTKAKYNKVLFLSQAFSRHAKTLQACCHFVKLFSLFLILHTGDSAVQKDATPSGSVTHQRLRPFALAIAYASCYKTAMSIAQSRNKQLSMDGPAYGRRHDISYRAGLVLQVLGTALLAVLYPLESPFYTIGIMLFDVGVFISVLYLPVRMRPAKLVILGSVISGLALQVAGASIVSEQHAGSVMITGIGFVCAGAGGMLGREAYCFGYREGWVLAAGGFPGMILTNLLGRENRIVNSLGFSILFLLLLSLTGKKLNQRLRSTCSRDASDAAAGMPGDA